MDRVRRLEDVLARPQGDASPRRGVPWPPGRCARAVIRPERTRRARAAAPRVGRRRLAPAARPDRLIVEARRSPRRSAPPTEQRAARFARPARELVAELPLLRRPVGRAAPAPRGPVARRMVAACWPHRATASSRRWRRSPARRRRAARRRRRPRSQGLCQQRRRHRDPSGAAARPDAGLVADGGDLAAPPLDGRIAHRRRMPVRGIATSRLARPQLLARHRRRGHRAGARRRRRRRRRDHHRQRGRRRPSGDRAPPGRARSRQRPRRAPGHRRHGALPPRDRPRAACRRPPSKRRAGLAARDESTARCWSSRAARSSVDPAALVPAASRTLDHGVSSMLIPATPTLPEVDVRKLVVSVEDVWHDNGPRLGRAAATRPARGGRARTRTPAATSKTSSR